MNAKQKFVYSLGLLGLLCVVTPGSLRADTVYTYTGNPYTECFGTYGPGSGTCNGTTPFVSITFKTPLAGAQLDNLSAIFPTITTITLTDNAGVTLTTQDFNGPNSSGHGWIYTWSNGDIYEWGFGAQWYASALPNSDWYSIYSTGSYSGFDDTSIYSDPSSSLGGSGQSVHPGVWSGPQSVPEPPILYLLGVALLGLMLMAALRKRRVPLSSC
jgi:hypothetical protein